MKWILLLALIPAVAFAETVNLIWESPTKRENGAPLAPEEIKEERLYNERKLVTIIPAGTKTAKVFTSPGKAYAWEVTAVDKKGLQSGYSNAVVWQPTPVPLLVWPPAAPGSLAIDK